MRASPATLVLLSTFLSAAGCSMQAVETRASFPAKVRFMRAPQRVHVKTVRVDGYVDASLRPRLERAIRASGFHRIAGDDATVHVTATGSTSYSGQPRESVSEKCVCRDRKNRCTKIVKVTRYDLVERCAVHFDVIGRNHDHQGAQQLFRAGGQQLLQKTQWKNGEEPRRARTELCSRARSLAFTKAIQAIVPQTRQVSVNFHKLGGEARTERAMNAVRSSDFAAAEAALRSVAQAGLPGEKGGWAHYNLGLLYYLTARFGLCAEQMDKAQERTGTTSHIGAIRDHCLEYDR